MEGKIMENAKLWAQEVAEKIKHKELKVAERNKNKIPYTTDADGKFDDHSDEARIGWWTNGFFGGTMWQLYHATKEPVYKENALFIEKALDKALMNEQGMDHDSGFRWLPTAVANWRETGDKEGFNRGLIAASDLAGRFNPVGKFIRAWNDDGDGSRAGWAIIDCMMNLPLLYWAYEQIHDPRFLQIATMHADTAQKYFIRQDGSSNHICIFDPATGEFLRTDGGQGYCVGSSWTRGQAWALYGFALSYIHTGNEEYLNTSRRVANYFIANTPESGLIPVDFRQPEDCTWQDSTAAAIAACGMLELAKHVKGADSRIYYNAAVKMLKALDEHSCNWDENVDHIVDKCSAAFHEDRHEYHIIYGDYYFIEAIWKLTGEELFIW